MVSLKSFVRNAGLSLIPGKRPSFFILGSQKSGTTALHYYLSQHKNLAGSFPKEVHFFDTPEKYSKGVRFYHAHFKSFTRVFGDYQYFESTPEYLYYKNIPELIHAYNPQAKFVIILREPVSRAFSAWNMYRSFCDSPGGLPESLVNSNDPHIKSLVESFYSMETFPEFEQCIGDEMKKIVTDSPVQEPSLVRRGLYFSQVKTYAELFGKEKLKIVGFREFIQNRTAVLNDILDFLGIPPSDWSFLKFEKRHAVEYKSVLSTSTKESLEKFYAPYNEELFRYIGKKLDW